MEFILYLLFFTLSFIVLSLLRHYFILFGDLERDQFDRSELIDFQKLIPRQMLSILEANGSMQDGLVAFILFSLISYGWSLLGGLIGSPHYTNEFGNYFFQSCFLFIGFFFGYSPVVEIVLGSKKYSEPDSFLVRFLSQETCVLIGVGLACISSNLAVYGMYHQMIFPFTILNILIISGLLIYKLKTTPTPRTEEKYGDEEEYNYEEESN
ncbi:MAG TPA: hypothetical protein PK079_19325 [Leptospiraceae bacterium]|nr:hypothetical protein [Leptospiraceae bacterium]HMW05614.1 hypothetical protein [Leptospiraceae bacterium]HMX34504.1 hypothetical protein [Leptospiraceae bacterium]HMY31123.1 hypothetical protein [Leptospiraceae bacterium]HMZ63706.1 hypothetical protein [Leptospiraceae bacterium]